MMEQCFVIQPFDETYNKRYDDIYEPAIRKAELKPYRVDQDLSTRVPTENIKRKRNDKNLYSL